MKFHKSVVSFISLSFLFCFAAEAACVPQNQKSIALSPTTSTTPTSSPVLKPAPAANMPNNIPELTRLCGFTDNPSFCTEVTTPFLNGESDAITILKAAMEAAQEYTLLALKEAKKCSLEGASPGAKWCIDFCVESYESALGDFETSFTAIKESVGSLNANLDATLTMVSTCEDTFAETPGVVSPMKDMDRILSAMINNCLAIRNAVKYIINPLSKN